MKLGIPLYVECEGYSVRVTHADVSLVDGQGFLSLGHRNNVLSLASRVVEGVSRYEVRKGSLKPGEELIDDKYGLRASDNGALIVFPSDKSIPSFFIFDRKGLMDDKGSSMEEVRA